MKARFSPLTAVVMIMAVLFLEQSPVFAQGCSQCICATDETCQNVDNCGTQTNCTRVQFTASCNGTYRIRATTGCTSGNCSYCRSCVNLYKMVEGVEVFQTNCHNDNCDTGECLQFVDFPLEIGKIYILYVCKQPCPNIDRDCDDCNESCKAYGCIYFPTSDLGCVP